MPFVHELSITAREVGNKAVVYLTGAMDHDYEKQFAAALDQPIADGASLTVVSLADLHFADTTLLSCLLFAQRQYRAADVPLVLAGPSKDFVRRIFEVTGTEHWFTFAPTVEAALNGDSEDNGAG
ncbi:STAS domain-containing protein [Streptomyces sp. SID14478]|uniref:STAS domain-containing protein n=1 Tax=Streptomyces sp. SID14478 TaxID=2706073 RepID=UPI0013DC12B9|nr:STAS domain-containing protein [Streptomyces sp. SID14478]NEB77360.1 STAS domain-containing protein [Streptomyces sp. SID14478]